MRIIVKLSKGVSKKTFVVLKGARYGIIEANAQARAKRIIGRPRNNETTTRTICEARRREDDPHKRLSRVR